MPLPVSVISDMLGVPASDWPGIREPVTALVASLEPGATAAELRASLEARDVLVAYFADLIERRTAEPADDLLTALIAARDEQDKLSNAEVLAVAILLFAAGAETTTNLIGNGMNALLNHPDQLEQLWNDPSLVPAMVEEVLRFDSPVQLDGRTCLEAAEFAGLSFEPGDRVITLLGGANHDPSKFEDPDRFDITRYLDTHDRPPAEPVMSFGSGIHYCLGANLARVEAQEAFAGLIRRFSSIEAAGERPYRQRMVLRGLEACPVKVNGIPR
jgi:cytochrome P450